MEIIPQKTGPLNFQLNFKFLLYFIPELFEYIRSYYPSISLNVKIDHSTNINDKINKKQIDLAIGVNLKSTHLNYHIHNLFNDHFSFFTSARYKLNLESSKLIYHPQATDQNGKNCYEYLSKFLKSHDAVTSENFETIKSLTLKSVGIGVLPRNVAAEEVKSGRLQSVVLPKLPQTFGVHQICLAYNQKLLQSHSKLIYEMIRIGNAWSFK